MRFEKNELAIAMAWPGNWEMARIEELRDRSNNEAHKSNKKYGFE